MQFNHPEVLYALFFLIIPIIVHLFQLRKFQKERFTNVKFLRRLTRQTRKSSQLKKWLVLATRLLLFTCIILAFAGPYFPQDQEVSGNIETVIYLDNSYSMQAAGQRGRLLDRSIQDLLELLPQDRVFTLITNDDEFREVTQSDLQNIGYSPKQASLNSLVLNAVNLFSEDTVSNKKLLLISDFQQIDNFSELKDLSGVQVYALPQRPERLENVSIDTVFQETASNRTIVLKVQLSYTGSQPGTTPVSFFDGNSLLGKASVDFSNGTTQTLEFPLDTQLIGQGIIQTEDNGLNFDNSLYFSINEIQPISITSIDGVPSRFLERIFQGPDFNFTPMPLASIDYNQLSSSRVVVLNEVEELPAPLETTLLKLAGEDVTFIVIPSIEGVGERLNSFVRNLGFAGYESRVSQEKLVTGISFQHPLYTGVFEEQVRNFEYPKTQVSYGLSTGASAVLSFEDTRIFLAEAGGNFAFAAPLNSANSNFIQSPLIVPTFYNMGILALQPTQLYYILGNDHKIDIPVTLPGDRVLEISRGEGKFIPQQQSFSNKVEVITGDLPQEPGTYTVLNNMEALMNVSFNIDRVQSNLNYRDITAANGVEIVSTLPQFFTTAGFHKELDTLWKWFVIFALIFLILETLLLKYFK